MVYWKNVFYGITPDVHWHQFLGVADGSPNWHSQSRTKIGSGFGEYTRVISPGGAGVLYGVKPNGVFPNELRRKVEMALGSKAPPASDFVANAISCPSSLLPEVSRCVNSKR